MKRISFSMTWAQHRARTKTTTRRMGWLHAKKGQLLQGVQKGMGLKKGEKHVLGHVIRLTDVRREPLEAITPEDVVREGFPGMSVDEFVAHFAAGHRCQPDDLVTVLDHEYVMDERCGLCLAEWRGRGQGRDPWRCEDCGHRQGLDPEVVDLSWGIALPDGSGALTLCGACFEARKDLLCSCGLIGDDGQLSFAQVGLDPRCPVHRRGRGAGWSKAVLEVPWRSGMSVTSAAAYLKAELQEEGPGPCWCSVGPPAEEVCPRHAPDLGRGS